MSNLNRSDEICCNRLELLWEGMDWRAFPGDDFKVWKNIKEGCPLAAWSFREKIACDPLIKNSNVLDVTLVTKLRKEVVSLRHDMLKTLGLHVEGGVTFKVDTVDYGIIYITIMNACKIIKVGKNTIQENI